MGFTTKDFEEKGLNHEQISYIMAERDKEKQADKAKIKSLESAISEKDNTITELNDTIKSFDGKDETLKDLQDKIANYEKSENDRKELEKQQQIESEIKNRFIAALGEQKFKHADIETGRFNAFKTALNDEKFKGKGDGEIFTEITN
ncbi:MAG: hypothetical protein BV456_06095, partial [Thermoplasmata archaeon M8B2D]